MLGDPILLEAARQGVLFLRKHFYDRQHGGFFLLTDRNGRIKNNSKWPYGQAFAIYALSEFYRSSREQEVLGLALQTFDIWQRHAWDSEFGGFFENLNRQWEPVSRIKRAGHLLHGMEAASSLYAATGDNRFRRFLEQLADTLVDRFFDPPLECIHEHFTTDWRPYSRLSEGLILYGHNLEAAWFLSALGSFANDGNRLNAARSLLNGVLNHGWDHQYNGIFMSGRPEGEPVDTGKMWWVQAAALGALSTGLGIAINPGYRNRLQWALEGQAAFIQRHLRDPQNGAWHLLVEREGTVRCGLKGHGVIDHLPIKCAYHVVQALSQILRDQVPARSRAKASRTHRKKWSDYCF
jgi:mannobiose 2-epimerase